MTRPYHGLNAVPLDASAIRDIRPDVLLENGHPRVLPAAFYQRTTVAERAALGARTGLYGLPTLELVDWLKDRIGSRSALEIGAGHGVLARALGIPATDSHLQDDPAVAAMYAAMGQALVPYGADVENLDAAAAIQKWRPQVVIASWVTHKYLPSRHEAGGNLFGVDESAVVSAVEAYIFIGNTAVHTNKSIWALPHTKIEPDWLYSRAHNGSADFIAVWGA